MKFTVGDSGDNILEGTSASDIMYGEGGDDHLYSQLDGNTPYAFDRLYGGTGNDELSFDVNDRVVQALRSGELVKPLADGGAGDDQVVIYYDGPVNYDISELKPLIDARNVERWSFDFLSSEGTIDGTSHSDWLSATTAEITKIDAGGGNDRVNGYVLDGSLTVDGGAGNDTLSGYYFLGSGRAKVSGGTGEDLFVFNDMRHVDTINGMLAQGMVVEDFKHGEDKILIDLSSGKYGDKYYYYLDGSSFHGKADADAYREHIDYNEKTGVLSIDGREHGVIDGSPHINSSDFLFI
jgi:Ca2+-binding RTX toxin-like protein